MKAHWTYKYLPDESFLKTLKGYDDNLDAYWDALANDWVIVRHGNTGSHEIGHYKNLDNRVMESLYEGDLWRQKKSKDFDQYIANHNGRIKEAIRQKEKERVEEVATKFYVDNLREHKTQF